MKVNRRSLLKSLLGMPAAVAIVPAVLPASRSRLENRRHDGDTIHVKTPLRFVGRDGQSYQPEPLVSYSAVACAQEYQRAYNRYLSRQLESMHVEWTLTLPAANPVSSV